MQCPGLAPRIGDRVIWTEGSDFLPGRIAAVTSSGRMIEVEFAEGGTLVAPATGFLVVPDSYLPPPPRRLSEVQQVELRYDGEIPPGALDAAERRDAAPEVIVAQRDAAAAWLAWLSTHLYPLDPGRFALHQARAALAAAAPAVLTEAA